MSNAHSQSTGNPRYRDRALVVIQHARSHSDALDLVTAYLKQQICDFVRDALMDSDVLRSLSSSEAFS